jgi:Raf kinase inhibitor-like YbhB/YbcL family protein
MMFKKAVAGAVLTALLTVVTATCQKEEKPETKSEPAQAKTEEIAMIKLELKSPAFSDGDTIPVKYTCDGPDVSVPLTWSKPPEGTKSLTLICDDPDAPMGTWVHWVVFNLPPDLTELREGISIKGDEKLGGAFEGINDFETGKYGGPCPPPGPAHRYFFKLYALDTTLNLKTNATKEDVEKAMKDHILAHGQLMGKYQRKR